MLLGNACNNPIQSNGFHIQHNKRAFFFMFDALIFNGSDYNEKIDEEKNLFRMENESHALNKIKWNMCCVVLNVVVVSLFIYSFVHAMPFYIIPCYASQLVGSFQYFDWTFVPFFCPTVWNGFGIWFLFFYLFRCENIWKYIWQTNYARK